MSQGRSAVLELFSCAEPVNYKYCMAQWFVWVHRTSEDPFNYPYFGKVQYFRCELLYHGFNLSEHPEYPGPYRARFIAAHDRDSMISFVALRYTDIAFHYTPLETH